MSGTLVVVPCGKTKIWKKNPNHGPVMAKDAYTGTLFRLNRQYAEQFGDSWVILSAKYGLISPDTLIEDYNVTFNDPSTNPAGPKQLREQVIGFGFCSFETIIALGGRTYRDHVRNAFSICNVEIICPFDQCRGIGDMMKQLKSVLDNGGPGHH
ncbi:MAG: hypothetical protein KAW93_05095 [Methanogenium sp.]|nr:hypothetical protein [Methanogenium sp.]